MTIPSQVLPLYRPRSIVQKYCSKLYVPSAPFYCNYRIWTLLLLRSLYRSSSSTLVTILHVCLTNSLASASSLDSLISQHVIVLSSMQ